MQSFKVAGVVALFSVLPSSVSSGIYVLASSPPPPGKKKEQKGVFAGVYGI